MKTKQVLCYVVVSAIIIFLGCEREAIKGDKPQENYIVNIEQAISIADEAMAGKRSMVKSVNSKKITSQKTFFDKNNSPYFHVINYSDNDINSFIIISGDKRTNPILAYSNCNDFPINSVIPVGVDDWLTNYMITIDSIRILHRKQEGGINKLWLNVKLPENIIRDEQLKNEPIDDPNNCTGSYSIVKNPILTTTWGQLCVYNQLCPSGCLESDCYHKPTGCTATAMAQILKFWHYQNNYNWSSMQNIYYSSDFGKTGANEVARLMKDAGQSVNMLYMCAGSLGLPSLINNAFSNTFNYSSGGTKDSFLNRIDDVKFNLLNNQPVIFSACSDITNCHVWVVDGIMESYDCVTGYGWLSYWMNWGWNSSYNGWYGINSWSPGGYNYQYNRDVIVNIHP